MKIFSACANDIKSLDGYVGDCKPIFLFYKASACTKLQVDAMAAKQTLIVRVLSNATFTIRVRRSLWRIQLLLEPNGFNYPFVYSLLQGFPFPCWRITTYSLSLSGLRITQVQSAGIHVDVCAHIECPEFPTQDGEQFNKIVGISSQKITEQFQQLNMEYNSNVPEANKAQPAVLTHQKSMPTAAACDDGLLQTEP